MADEKHGHYMEHHVPGEVFWGIGVENETYIELAEGQTVAADFVLRNQARERYSVNYWTTYKPEVTTAVIKSWISRLPRGSDTVIHLPLLVNGHSLTRCDRWGEHRTTYTRVPEPNPRFSGRTLLEDLSGARPEVFGPHPWWCFDGDTVEFITQDFRNTTIERVVEELVELKTRWMTAFREGLEATGARERMLMQTPRWPLKNYGFAVFHTNRRHVAIFNNGTYHLNITAPTLLDKDGAPADAAKFVSVHRAGARLFQWLSPFFVARHGSPDPFSTAGIGVGCCGRKGPKAPLGSQRLAVSRYVGVGTYDTRTMRTGKILTEPRDTLGTAEWHRHALDRAGCMYAPLDAIGFDVNFAKFRNHGLELRIFDWFPEEELLDVLRMCVWMLDEACGVAADIPYPQDSPAWRAVVERSVWNGVDALLTANELREWGAVFGAPTVFKADASGTLPILTAYRRLFDFWAAKHGRRGPCSRRMMATLPSLSYRIPVIEHMRDESEERAERCLEVEHVVVVRLVKKMPFKVHLAPMAPIAPQSPKGFFACWLPWAVKHA